ncbi:hypothetical protein M2447_001520 [Ereboglobus sp. PH5-10]|uniref:hypothetical protein n=1 Tax=Ereboglobus sp. PH5-10 TaxID=2940629 RepID=UPI0024053FCC|nr:hypothetical protein [Ereboglobus sp. PH5-10]MDF9827427.1 hypothetical protein [Ereboglobus sp. PH5-10]
MRLLLTKHDKLLAAGVLAMVVIAFFAPVLLCGKTLLGRDFTIWFYGVKHFFRESVLNGDFPFWCPQLLGGTPLLASWQHALLYPPSIIWIIFPTAYAFGVFAALHHWMFAWYSYLLARECRAGMAGAWITACTAFATSSLLHVTECTEHLGGFAWLPLILYFFLGVLRGGGWKKTVGLAVACSLMTYAGSPYPLLMTLIGMIVTGIPFWLCSKKRLLLPKVLQHGVISAGLVFLLTAPQLLPMLELALQASNEHLQRDPAIQLHYSMWAADWIKSLVPTFFGMPMEMRHAYFGVLPMMLLEIIAVVILLRRWRWTPSVIAITALMLTGIVMASGPSLQLHKVMSLMPAVNRMYSYPATYVILVTVALPVLAGLSIRPLRRMSPIFRRCLYCATIMVALAVFLVRKPIETWGSSMRALPHFSADIRSLTAGMNAFPIDTSLHVFIILAIGSIGVILLLANPHRWRLALLATTLFLFADKTLLRQDMRMFGDVNVYVFETPSMHALKKVGADRELARIHKTFHMMGESHILSGSNNPNEFAWIRNFLPCSVGLALNFSQTNISGTLNIPETERFWASALNRYKPWQNDRLRGLWNVKWIMDIKRSPEKGYTSNLRENSNFMPRAWHAGKVMTANDPNDVLRMLIHKDSDPRGTVLVYAKPSDIPMNLLNQNTGYAPAQAVVQTNNTITVTTSIVTDTVLLVADTYYKWWRAEIDGVPARVFKANMAQKAVMVPAGRHTVRLYCVPVSFYTGCGLFIIAIPLIIFLLRLDMTRRPSPAKFELQTINNLNQQNMPASAGAPCGPQ